VLAETRRDNVAEPHVELGVGKTFERRHRVLEQPRDILCGERRGGIPERCLFAPVPLRAFGRVVENEQHPVRKAQMSNGLLHRFDFAEGRLTRQAQRRHGLARHCEPKAKQYRAASPHLDSFVAYPSRKCQEVDARHKVLARADQKTGPWYRA
jgi:hypothetical protein